MAKRIAVVVSQGQSNNPAKRELEENLVAGLLMERGIDVTLVPHLYDLSPEGTGMLALQNVAGDLIVCAWLFPRAARWTLDRHGVRGQEGVTLLRAAGEEDEDDEEAESQADDKPRVIETRDAPKRKIYCLDLRAHHSAQPYIDEIKRIAAEAATQTVSLAEGIDAAPPAPKVVEESPSRRWYPVIDYSRCTNCMECVDFCLFGVYGLDRAETILVEQPDNCRKGCPACSRVCPENAIIFPQHKTPTIAGSNDMAAGGIKIDLSQLFGAPADEDPLKTAARERDEQLLLAGRDAVGLSVGVPKRQANQPDQPKDELDDLIDQLDELEL